MILLLVLALSCSLCSRVGSRGDILPRLVGSLLGALVAVSHGQTRRARRKRGSLGRSVATAGDGDIGCSDIVELV
eukprot:413555-Pyramimonas_sp.AAC.2